MTTADLLQKWRDAITAAELARRLAEVAKHAADDADESAVASEALARLAEKAAVAAEEAAANAREVADRAAVLARSRAGQRADADGAETLTTGQEGTARDAYHAAEHEARERHAEEPIA